MYHNPVGPAALTGLGAGAGLAALTPLGLVWILLAAFAVAGAAAALLRVAPPSITEAPRRTFTRRQGIAPRR